MLRIVGLRLAALLPLLLVVSLLIFLLLEVAPSDAAARVAGEGATRAEVEAARERLGLNRPLPVRYIEWVGATARGDLGTSFFASHKVIDIILARAPTTISLTGLALLLAILIGVPLGSAAAVKSDGLLDRLVTGASAVGLAIPSFWLGMLLLLAFSLNRDWLPATGYAPLSQGGIPWLKHLILPATALGASAAAEFARQARGSLRDSLEQDYVRMAEAKGLLRVQVVGKHALKNGAIPLVTVAGLQVGRLLSGAVVVETLFNLRGIGDLALAAVITLDLPLVQGVVIVSTFAVVIANLLVDLSYAYLDPRARAAT